MDIEKLKNYFSIIETDCTVDSPNSCNVSCVMGCGIQMCSSSCTGYPICSAGCTNSECALGCSKGCNNLNCSNGCSQGCVNMMSQ